jgi:hypothetical protein
MCFDYLHNFVLNLSHSKKTERFSEKNNIGHKICVLIICTTLSEIFLILRRTERDIVINTPWAAYKVPFIFSGFKIIEKLNFLHIFWKNTQISDVMKICPVGVGFLHADERTDRYEEADNCFSQFCERA